MQSPVDFSLSASTNGRTPWTMKPLDDSMLNDATDGRPSQVNAAAASYLWYLACASFLAARQCGTKCEVEICFIFRFRSVRTLRETLLHVLFDWKYGFQNNFVCCWFSDYNIIILKRCKIPQPGLCTLNLVVGSLQTLMTCDVSCMRHCWRPATTAAHWSASASHRQFDDISIKLCTNDFIIINASNVRLLLRGHLLTANMCVW